LYINIKYKNGGFFEKPYIKYEITIDLMLLLLADG